MKHNNILVTLLILMLVCGCKVGYNFTGGSIDPNIKTISIQSFFNQSGNGPPTMNLQMTEKLKAFYQGSTKLQMVKENGDWQLEGMITRYYIQPIAPQQNETAAQTRLTITVNATFNDIINNRNFKKDFSFYSDFPQSQSLSQVENEKVPIILDQIVLDIFTSTTSNW